jgi:hypothetical protein
VAAERPAEPLVYRPISGPALAGLIFAALYAAIVLFSVVLAFVRREPFFLPGWMLTLAVAGAVLSFLGLRQIRASEGTRAGTPLARWGLWLSVLFGLGSVTFSFFTGLAVRQQANRFLTEKGPGAGFFPLLQEGNVNAAFLLTWPPDARGQVNPNNDREMEKVFDTQLDDKEPRGRLSFFRATDFVQVLGQPYDTPAEVVLLGGGSWSYESKGYSVELTYQIRNPEGEFDIKLKAQSLEGAAPGEGRKWMVVWDPRIQPPLVEVQTTPLGKKMRRLRQSAVQFANFWLAKLTAGIRFEVYADLMEPAQAAKLRQSHLMHLQAAPVSALTAAPGDPRPLLRTTLHEAAALALGSAGKAPKGDAGPVVAQRLRVRSDDQAFREGVERAASRLGRGREQILRSPPRIRPDQVKFARWQVKEGRLEIALEVALEIQPLPQAPADLAVVFGKLILDADSGADPNRPDQSVWRVVRLELDLALPKRTQPTGLIRGPG